MKLKLQKTLAAQLLKASRKRVRFHTEELERIKEAITKSDVRALINDKLIWKKKKKGISRCRVKQRKQGPGSRKGKSTARLPKKKHWMNQIRAQRRLLRELRKKNRIENRAFRVVYEKAKGGFFRSRRHINLYLEEKKLLK